MIRAMVLEHQIHADNVRQVDISLPATRRREHVSRGPFTNANQAASSLPFQVSMLLLDGETNPARYAEYDSPVFAALIDRIRIDFDAKLKRGSARITIDCEDGTTYDDEREWRPFPEIDPLEALSLGRDHGLPRANVERAAHLVAHLESVTDVGELMEALRPEAR